MIRPELLELLQCPETKRPLRPADESVVARINQGIAAGTIRNRVEETVDTPLSGGLVSEGGSVLYPIIDDVPVMLAEEAIPLEQLRSGEASED
ncbi:MAG: Trm112 family protein [Thermoguttaceae bacterium]